MSAEVGVGFIGAGPVTQAIHLPTLATLADRLRVAHVMDVDKDIAAAVADRVGARATTDVQAVLNDPAVDVVCICSPDRFHADQVTAACQAGKKAVLCEKPLATTVDEAQRIANVSKRTGIPVIVGTMHTYDPAYLAAHRSWMTSGATATLVRSVIYLPPNEAFVEVATDLVGAPAPSRPPDLARPGAQAARLRGAVLGLAIHTIPLVRRLIPTIDAVRVAKLLQPFGYVLTLTSGARSAQLVGFMPGQWRADWTFQAWAAGHELRVQFPPSYVLAGSATAEYATPTSRSVWHFPQNGYQVEWLHVANIAQGYEVPSVSLDEAVEDLHFALQVADGAGARLQE